MIHDIDALLPLQVEEVLVALNIHEELFDFRHLNALHFLKWRFGDKGLHDDGLLVQMNIGRDPFFFGRKESPLPAVLQRVKHRLGSVVLRFDVDIVVI